MSAAGDGEEAYGRGTTLSRGRGQTKAVGEVLRPDLRQKLAFLGVVGGFLVIGSMIGFCNNFILSRGQDLGPDALVSGAPTSLVGNGGQKPVRVGGSGQPGEGSVAPAASAALLYRASS